MMGNAGKLSWLWCHVACCPDNWLDVYTHLNIDYLITLLPKYRSLRSNFLQSTTISDQHHWAKVTPWVFPFMWFWFQTNQLPSAQRRPDITCHTSSGYQHKLMSEGPYSGAQSRSFGREGSLTAWVGWKPFTSDKWLACSALTRKCYHSDWPVVTVILTTSVTRLSAWRTARPGRSNG